jgi:hypothetical protein
MMTKVKPETDKKISTGACGIALERGKKWVIMII